LILPVTLLFFEPGINGACKWKVQSLLRDEGFEMPEGNGRPSPFLHTASESSRQWADKSEMKDLVATWGTVNHGRWALGILAAAVSGLASLWK